jgi:hypothetical protein
MRVRMSWVGVRPFQTLGVTTARRERATWVRVVAVEAAGVRPPILSHTLGSATPV